MQCMEGVLRSFHYVLYFFQQHTFRNVLFTTKRTILLCQNKWNNANKWQGWNNTYPPTFTFIKKWVKECKNGNFEDYNLSMIHKRMQGRPTKKVKLNSPLTITQQNIFQQLCISQLNRHKCTFLTCSTINFMIAEREDNINYKIPLNSIINLCAVFSLLISLHTHTFISQTELRSFLIFSIPVATCPPMRQTVAFFNIMLCLV